MVVVVLVTFIGVRATYPEDFDPRQWGARDCASSLGSSTTQVFNTRSYHYRRLVEPDDPLSSLQTSRMGRVAMRSTRRHCRVATDDSIVSANNLDATASSIGG
jgi:hypothetical protein